MQMKYRPAYLPAFLELPHYVLIVGVGIVLISHFSILSPLNLHYN